MPADLTPELAKARELRCRLLDHAGTEEEDLRLIARALLEWGGHAMPADLTPEARAKAREAAYPYTASDACIQAIARALLEWGAERDAVVEAARRLTDRINSGSDAYQWIEAKELRDALALVLTPAAVSERARLERAVVEAAMRWYDEGYNDGERVLGDACEKLYQLRRSALDAPPAGGA